MWTLICVAAQRNGFRAGSPSDAGCTNGAAVRGAIREQAPRHGRNGERAREPEVRIYMHPGRMPVGEVDLARAGEQFDLKRAELFGSLDEAEPACADRVGFLLELSDSSPDSPGRARGGGAVLFVEGLRG